MAKTYQEYLAENGATAEEIAVLATPKAIAAYNKIQADAQKERTDALAAAEAEFNEKNQQWWNDEYKPGLDARDAELLKIKGENARITASLAEAKRLGLTQIAIDAGHEPDAAAIAAAAAAKNTPGFDPNKYVSATDFQSAFDRTGEAIATAQTLFAEHHALFGTFPTDMEDMRKAAVASRGQKNIRQIWEEKYKVADKRKELAAAEQKKHDDKIAADTEARIRSEYSANPSLGIPRVSKNSFTQRPIDDKAKEKLWDSNGVPKNRDLQRERVQKYASKVQ
jgi:hypothetical protein